ncbi:hypothetical protein HK096_007991, partial [Nowakowskiella sp. JEL0078]
MTPRVMITVTLLLANKFLEEVNLPNAMWAWFSGIDVQILNNAEREVLTTLDYTLWLKQDELDEWFALIQRFVKFDSKVMANCEGQGKIIRVDKDLAQDQ